jgi:hypothetical protein
MTLSSTPSRDAQWPPLPLDVWHETYETLHLWTQIVGKLRLESSPPVNHWWHVTLYLTSRGLTTLTIPQGARSFQVDFDFIDHRLVIAASDGAPQHIALEPKSVAAFYGEVMDALKTLDLDVPIDRRPSEIPDPIPFDQDEQHASYDPDAANRCWRVMLQTDRVFKEFRSHFRGKSSPAHFFWGGFDLAVTRFSGRPAPRHPGGIPNLPDRVVQEAYSDEVSSAGWWPGGGPVDEPIFYSYMYPEPLGFPTASVQPATAYYHPTLREFILPYESVRTAADPDAMLLAFLQSTYEAGANLADWNRSTLER